MRKVLSADGKRAVLPGSPRGPGEPRAPAGVPGQKPAEPTTRLSIRTRAPTLKHPLRSLHSQLLLHGGLTPGTPTRFSGLAFVALPGSPCGPRGTWLSARPPGRPKAVLPTMAVQPDPGARLHLPAHDPFNTQPFTAKSANFPILQGSPCRTGAPVEVTTPPG